MGSEKHLVHTLTGRETPARALTADIGVVVHNIATAFAVHDAVVNAIEDDIYPLIVESAKAYIFPGAERGLKFVASKLGDEAGITGAAVLARRHAT